MTLTEPVTVALRERPERVRRTGNGDVAAGIRHIQLTVRDAGGNARPRESDDHIVGYHDDGLPR